MTIHNKLDRQESLKEDLQKCPTTICRTSGTSSKATYVCFNDYDIKAITTIGARCFQNAGLHPGIVVVNTMNSSMWCGGCIDSLSLAASGATVINFSVGNTKELIQVILDLGVTAIHCTPSYIDKIAKTAKLDYGLEPNQLGIKLLLTGGEAGVQNKNFRERIEKLWNASLIDANYGQADSVSLFASEDFRYKNGLTFLGDDLLTAEIAHDDMIEGPKVGLKGELLVTTHWKYGLIDCQQYHTGDIIEVTEILDNGRFRFKVLGRADDMLVIRGLNVYPSTVRDVYEKFLLENGLEGKLQIHVSAKPPVQNCMVVIDATDDTELLNDLVVEIRKATSVTFVVKYGEVVEGSTGKTKLVIKDL